MLVSHVKNNKQYELLLNFYYRCENSICASYFKSGNYFFLITSSPSWVDDRFALSDPQRKYANVEPLSNLVSADWRHGDERDNGKFGQVQREAVRSDSIADVYFSRYING
ncbi:hypothetical protein EVAR_52565_1 [Eumeta japonica]|uniref:Uncharacterized protein n=1 Tax=Eumeta variegata TaxID=151549 RepID=A0A4C1YAY6_EUMVA|nr:hypothetical protein EVAR_52565_1 [Eumeta japonica]